MKEVFSLISLLIVSALQMVIDASGLECAVLNISAEDTIRSEGDGKEIKLKEFVVEATNRKDIKDGIAFYPDKKEKKFATDAITLLEEMALTELPFDISKRVVTNAAGVPVTYFIDGREATQRELTALNPKDVDRIEYFPMPTSSEYANKQNVVNFVTKKYLSGGYTKGDITQYLNGKSGNYNVSSKLAYKEMTYDLYLTGSYRNYSHIGQDGVNLFKDIEYGGSEYGHIKETVSGFDKNAHTRKLGAMFNASWQHKRVRLSISTGWNWERVPKSAGSFATVYTPPCDFFRQLLF